MTDVSSRGVRPHWTLNVYPDAGEAGGCLIVPRRTGDPSPVEAGVDLPDLVEGGSWLQGPMVLGGEPALTRSELEAARRARTKIRRYAASHRLNRFITLTYRGAGCRDPLAFRSDIAGFFRALRRELGGAAFPYVWVPEWHPGGHGLHGHAGVGRYIKRSKLVRAWPHGFVHIKLIGDLPVGSGSLEEARRCGQYLGKYVAKSVDADRWSGLHRYDVARGFEPRVVTLDGRTADQVIGEASRLMGRAPSSVWKSTEQEGWDGPPCCSLRW